MTVQREAHGLGVNDGSRLNTFNSLALHYQDEAYTLAYYTLGDEARAVEVTQAAFARLYLAKSIMVRQELFRRELLRNVLRRCGNEGIPVTGAGREPGLVRRLQTLDVKTRAAVVLVDVLDLSYDEAVRVLDCPKKQFMGLVAQARLRLVDQVRFA